MAIYWVMFVLPALGSMFGLGQHIKGQRRDQAFLVLLFVAFAVVMGLRWYTGGDFINYLRTVNIMAYERFTTSLEQNDVAFTVIVYVSNWLGIGIYGLNMTCALLMLYGLLRFVRTLPDPWLAIAAAVPYMIIVIGMGYIRQGVAIGFLLLAMMDLGRKSYGWLAFHIVAALTFHITALCFLPLIALSIARRQPVALVALTLVGVLAYFLILRVRLNGLYNGYVLTAYDSSGTLIRLLMNAVPATIFLAFYKRFPVAEPAKTTWLIVSLLSLAMVPALRLFQGSTVVDRIGLYFSPIQLVVFGHVATIFGANVREQRLISFASLLFYGAVLFVWLNYATNAGAWIPYRWILSSDAGA